MGRPILRLATRINRRTRWTAWAIALACMVLVGSLSLVDGLSAGVDSVTARFSTGPTVYLRGSDLLSSAVDEATLVVVPTDYAVVRVHAGTLTANGLSEPVVVASLTDYHLGNASVPFPSDPHALAIDSGLRSEIEGGSGRLLESTANLSVFGLAPQRYSVSGPPTSRPSFFPDTWVWVQPGLIVGLSPSQGGPVQAVLTPSPLDPGLVSGLGLTALQTVGAIGFTRASIAEARAVLLALGGILGVVIGLLAYNSMGVEVSLRREEIRTLRSVGASPSTVAAVYEMQALVLALVGATLGSALGIVLAHAVVSFAPLVGFPNLVLFSVPAVPVGLAYLLATAAAAVGGIVPTRRAVRIVRAAPEARPS